MFWRKKKLRPLTQKSSVLALTGKQALIIEIFARTLERVKENII